MMQFEFRPQWKEELVCSCVIGSFLLEMPMGVVSVCLPTKDRWQEIAPQWALELWDVLHPQLQEWCEQRKIPLYVDAAGYAAAWTLLNL